MQYFEELANIWSLLNVISPWQNPLPLEEYTTDPVVVYFYNGSWVPITHYPLKQAIALYQKAEEQGYNLFIFPTHVHPTEFEAPKQLGEERDYFQERRLSQERSTKELAYDRPRQKAALLDS